MLKRQQAKLLEELFLLISKSKGIKVGEEFLYSLLADEVHSRSQLNDYLTSFLQDDVYVNKYLRCKDAKTWLLNFEQEVLSDFITKYEEVGTWKPI